MSDPRWTDETEALVRRVDGLHRIDFKMAGAICGCHHWTLPVPYNAVDAHAAHERHRATELLAVLADAGLLVQPGGETRTEWAYQVDGQPAPWGMTRDRARAVSRLTAHREAWPHVPANLVRRTVHEGPWQPATQEAPQP